MSVSDRTQLKQNIKGSLSNPTIANADLVVAQDAQRFDGVVIGAATTAATTYTFPLARVDRQVQIKELRALPGGAVAASGTNYVTVALAYNDDAGGANTTAASMNTSATSWASGTSQLAALTAANVLVPAGSQLFVTITPSGTGVSIPAQTVFQVIWEEV